MKKLLLKLGVLALLLLPSQAFAKDSYKIAWSHYTGWEPWGYIQEKGLLSKWGEKYNIDVKAVLLNDYIESINLYTAGEFDGVTVTNMDALTIPAVGGIDTSAIIIGDYSNGNDAIVTQGVQSLADLKGQEVKLVELSVSHYMLARALDSVGLSEKDIKVVNTSDADIGGLFMSNNKVNVVTWNPIVNEIKAKPGANIIYDSSQIPGEILDMLVVRHDAPENLKKALVGAWYEAMGIINGEQGESAKSEAIEFMAKQAGGTVDQFNEQLMTTAMFYTAEDAIKYSTPETLQKTMDYVRTFSFDKGLYGEGMDSPDSLGIQFPDGSVLGAEDNIKLRFDNTYMALARDGTLY